MSRRALGQQRATDAEGSRARCKRLADFIAESWPVLFPDVAYVPNWHIDFICRHLEAVTFGELLVRGLENRVLFNVPPSSAKSLILTVFWPAWEWGPAALAHMQYIATSHRDEACMRDSRRFRKLVDSAWYQARWPETRLVRASDHKVENGRGGSRETVPFGSLMGGKCDRLLIDDPHSIDNVESDLDRAAVERRFRDNATSRLNDPVRSAILVIMQRLHQKDLSGVILDNKMPYVHVMLPMRYEPENACRTPLGEDPRTREGELLWLSRFPASVVNRDEATMTEYAVAGQHQQRPTPRGGLMFKRAWFKIAHTVPPATRWVRGWDLAASLKKSGAYTAGVKLGYDTASKHYYIGHVARERVANPETILKRVADEDGVKCAISVPQDPGQAGLVQVRALVAVLTGFQVHASPESGEKTDRAIPVASQAEIGNVSLLAGDWNETFLAEIEMFPFGRYKDQTDALSRASAWHARNPVPGFAAPIIVSTPLQTIGDYQ